MLENLITPPTDPHRVVVIGASQFVGKACSDLLETGMSPAASWTGRDRPARRGRSGLWPTGCYRTTASWSCQRALPAGRRDVARQHRDDKTVCAALGEHPVRHVVYKFRRGLRDDGAADGGFSDRLGSMHGVMHLTREIMLRECVPDTLAVLRPTLIYGAEDHNGYGPNRFRRLAADGEDIVLFGEGEERRDHVLVDDVAELVVRMLRSSNTGTLNAATGRVTSFRNIAETIASMFDTGTVVKSSPRVGQMPHNGYRPFDPATTAAAFPDFAYTPLGAGLKQVHSQTVKTENG